MRRGVHPKAVKSYFVYLTADRHRGTIYTGMTRDLNLRISQHEERTIPGFTSKYHANQLVYFEETSDVLVAIAREKQIKGWTRAKKITLIESVNPHWEDLTEARNDPTPPPDSFAEVAHTDRESGRRSE
jgi:putative endonuclease